MALRVAGAPLKFDFATSSLQLCWSFMPLSERCWSSGHAASSYSPNPIAAISAARAAGKGTTFRTTVIFPANFVTLLAVIWLDGEALFLGGNCIHQTTLNCNSTPNISSILWRENGSCTAVWSSGLSILDLQENCFDSNTKAAYT